MPVPPQHYGFQSTGGLPPSRRRKAGLGSILICGLTIAGISFWLGFVFGVAKTQKDAEAVVMEKIAAEKKAERKPDVRYGKVGQSPEAKPEVNYGQP